MVRCLLKELAMNISFGIYASPSSTLWKDIRKGPPLDAVREHLDRVVNFSAFARSLAGPRSGDGVGRVRRRRVARRRRSRLACRLSHFRLGVADPYASSLR